MGRHAYTDAPDRPTIPADCLAFVLGKTDDPNQVRAYWVREDGTSHLELENAAGQHFPLRLDQMPQLAVLLRGAPDLAVMS
jgi:hypothetical protein